MSDTTGAATGAKDTSAQEFLEQLDAATRRIEQRRVASQNKKRKAMDDFLRSRTQPPMSRKTPREEMLSKTKVVVVKTRDTHPATTPAQEKKTIGDFLRETDGVDEGFDVIGKAELDDGFAVVQGDGPSSLNGGVCADVVLDAAEAAFQPTMKTEKNCDDELDEDEGDERGTGSLEVWKWVGEKPAKVSGDGNLKRAKAVRFHTEL